MDDVDLAFITGEEIGRLYKSGKDFSESTPALALSFLRGFAAAYCDIVCRDLAGLSGTLAEKIQYLKQREEISSPAYRHLRVLLLNGNKAAHPENFEYIGLDFRVLVADALHAARELIETLSWLKSGVVPEYTIAPVQSETLREMCAKAMLDQDLDSMYLAGTYFLERAECEPVANACILIDGYPLTSQGDIEMSLFWFKRAAKRDHPGACYQYGYQLAKNSPQESERFMEGERYIARAAQAEFPDALIYVGYASLTGSALFDKDEVYARKLFEDAAQLGHPQAWAQLGAMESLGIGGKTDNISALRYTVDAANAGIPQAQFNLFAFYIDSNVPEERLLAVTSLQDAAAQDFPNAVYHLAVCIQAGWIAGRYESEAESEFVRSLEFPDFRARSAISAAQMIEARTGILSELARAANYLQICYELTINDDPHDLQGECLSASRRVVDRMRQHLNRRSLDESISPDDIILTLMLFDKNCIPCADRSERMELILNSFRKSDDLPSALSSAEMLLRGTCLDGYWQSTNSGDSNNTARAILLGPGVDDSTIEPMKRSRSVGRNENCPCGSGRKFKKCHRK